MASYRLTYNVEGWNFIKKSSFYLNPSESYGIAHDIVEHINGIDSIGTIEDELEALGAFWETRCKYQDVRRDMQVRDDPQETLANDLYNVIIYWNRRKLYFKKTYKHPEDQSFLDAIELFKLRFKNYQFTDLNENDFTQDQIDYFCNAALNLLRVGSRKLIRKYRKYDYIEPSMAANAVFYNIVEAIKEAESYIVEGSEVKLTIYDTHVNIYWNGRKIGQI